MAKGTPDSHSVVGTLSSYGRKKALPESEHTEPRGRLGHGHRPLRVQYVTTSSPGTREKSWTLYVTTGAASTSAAVAMSRSMAPMRCPGSGHRDRRCPARRRDVVRAAVSPWVLGPIPCPRTTRIRRAWIPTRRCARAFSSRNYVARPGCRRACSRRRSTRNDVSRCIITSRDAPEIFDERAPGHRSHPASPLPAPAARRRGGDRVRSYGARDVP